MGKLKSLFLFISLMGCLSLQAAPKSRPKSRDIQKLRSQIYGQKKELKTLGKQLSGLEKTLGKKNKRYIAVLKKRKLIEDRLHKMKGLILEETLLIKNEMQNTQELLRSIVANSLGDEEGAEDLLAKKIFSQNLKIRLNKFNALYKKNSENKRQMLALDKRLKEYWEVENELSSLIGQLEQQKLAKSSKYYQTRKGAEKLQGQLDQMKVKYVSTKKGKSLRATLGTFAPPIGEHTRIEYKTKKGVTFSFNKRQPVYATRAGQITYTGTLSTYGNVVMIKHNKDTRSVVFGEFTPKIKKGVTVKKGQILGYTTSKNDERGKIYFEVRRKNKAQNTIHLLEKGLLARK